MSADREGTCPLGGLWYTCSAQSPTFFGCCVSNPCNGIGCPAADLRPAGMGVAAGPDLAVNDSSFWPNVKCVTASWWTCALQTPSFQGCCDSTPCGGKGCPLDQLHPAAFSTLPPVLQTSFSLSAMSAVTPATSTFLTSTSSTSTSLISTSSTSISSINASPAGQTTVASLPQSSISSSLSPTAAIIGGVVGGVVFFAMLGIIVCLLRRKRYPRNNNSTNNLQEVDQSAYFSTSTNEGEANPKASSRQRWHGLNLGSPKWNRFILGSMPSAQHSPITPPPLYGQSPNSRAIDEIHELGATFPSSPNNSENLGLGVRVSELQEADAQADTPNPFPVQREWSRRRMSELADSPADISRRDPQRDIQPGDRDRRRNYDNWQSWGH